MTGVFDNALERRFTDSPVLVLANVDGVDVLLIHNGADGLVYRIQASVLASFINAAQQTALNAKANKAGETFTGPVVLNYATPLFTAWNASATSWGGYEWKQGSSLDAEFKQYAATGELRLSTGRNSSWGGHFTLYVDTSKVWEVRQPRSRYRPG
jgi:hypothetical protein